MKFAFFLRRLALAFWLATAVVPAVGSAQSVPDSAASANPPGAATPADSSATTPAQQAAAAEALIKASQNPVGNIAIIPFQNNFNYGVGPYQRLQYNLNLQPVVPIMLNQQWNLIARTIIPIINNPSAAPPAVCASPYGCGSTFGIGDINPQFYFAPSKPGNLIWGAGPQFGFPTAAPGTLGAGKYSVGPTLVGLIMPGNIVTGVLTNQLWSIAGSPGRPPISTFLIQPFFNYNFKHGWALSTGPTITANWTAPSSQGKWLVPLGGGVVKTFKLGSSPMQLGLFYYGNVARPQSAPYGQIRFNWALLFPVKRGVQLPS